MRLHSSQQGLALIAVLIFLEVLSVLSAFALQQRWWDGQLTKRLKNKNTIMVLAQAQLQTIEKMFETSVPGCVIPVTPAPILTRKSLDWWRSVSCAGNFQAFQYYYVVEFMGPDPCAFIGTEPNDPMARVAYYRLTMAITPSSDPGQKWLLQSTLTKRVTAAAVCAGRRYAVALGRQRWQELF